MNQKNLLPRTVRVSPAPRSTKDFSYNILFYFSLKMVLKISLTSGPQ